MEGAGRIISGTAEGKPINVHGHDVITYEAGENVLLYDAWPAHPFMKKSQPGGWNFFESDRLT